MAVLQNFIRKLIFLDLLKMFVKEIDVVRDQDRLNRVLLGRQEGNKPLGRSRHRWEDNIKWKFKKRDADVWSGLFRLWRGTSCGLI
jgi:hypothetical protein